MNYVYDIGYCKMQNGFRKFLLYIKNVVNTFFLSVHGMLMLHDVLYTKILFQNIKFLYCFEKGDSEATILI